MVQVLVPGSYFHRIELLYLVSIVMILPVLLVAVS